MCAFRKVYTFWFFIILIIYFLQVNVLAIILTDLQRSSGTRQYSTQPKSCQYGEQAKPRGGASC